MVLRSVIMYRTYATLRSASVFGYMHGIDISSQMYIDEWINAIN